MDDCLIVQGQSQVGFTCIHTQKADKTLQQMFFRFSAKEGNNASFASYLPFFLCCVRSSWTAGMFLKPCWFAASRFLCQTSGLLFLMR